MCEAPTDTVPHRNPHKASTPALADRLRLNGKAAAQCCFTVLQHLQSKQASPVAQFLVAAIGVPLALEPNSQKHSSKSSPAAFHGHLEGAFCGTERENSAIALGRDCLCGDGNIACIRAARRRRRLLQTAVPYWTGSRQGPASNRLG